MHRMHSKTALMQYGFLFGYVVAAQQGVNATLTWHYLQNC